MKNPSIVFTAPSVAELVDRDFPAQPREYEVRLKLMCTSVSAGTERSVLMGNLKAAGYSGFPRQSGYSAGAIVDAVGSKVTRVKVGDRVAASWTRHSRYYVLEEHRVYPLPDEISFSEAALVHIATFPMAAIRKCNLEIGESAIIMGLGVLGLVSIDLLRAAGAVPIIAVDPVPEKRALALKLGADYALDPYEEGFAKTVKSLTGGGANVAIEVTGLGSGLDMVLDCMARFGRVALLGCTRSSDFTIDYYRKVHAPGITMIGAHTQARPRQESHAGWWTERDDIKALFRLCMAGRLNLAALLEEIHSPLECGEVYARLAAGGGFPVVQFDWTQLED
jgi:threonine dehydrogenase-like Zn-dependent dehydrogenase